MPGFTCIDVYKFLIHLRLFLGPFEIFFVALVDNIRFEDVLGGASLARFDFDGFSYVF